VRQHAPSSSVECVSVGDGDCSVQHTCSEEGEVAVHSCPGGSSSTSEAVCGGRGAGRCATPLAYCGTLCIAVL
jgi:hypothetical protein